MKLLLIAVLIVASSCTYFQKKDASPKDIFEVVFEIKKDPTLEKVLHAFGTPSTISPTRYNKNIDEYYFTNTSDHPTISVFIDRTTKKATAYGVTLSLEVDTYDYLKERFKGYEWREKPLPSKAVDFVEELYLVEIPELGIGFQYDNQDPLRRPLWIYIE